MANGEKEKYPRSSGLEEHFIKEAARTGAVGGLAAWAFGRRARQRAREQDVMRSNIKSSPRSFVPRYPIESSKGMSLEQALSLKREQSQPTKPGKESGSRPGRILREGREPKPKEQIRLERIERRLQAARDRASRVKIKEITGHPGSTSAVREFSITKGVSPSPVRISARYSKPFKTLEILSMGKGSPRTGATLQQEHAKVRGRVFNPKELRAAVQEARRRFPKAEEVFGLRDTGVRGQRINGNIQRINLSRLGQIAKKIGRTGQKAIPIGAALGFMEAYQRHLEEDE